MPFYNGDNEEILQSDGSRIPSQLTWHMMGFMTFVFKFLVKSSDGNFSLVGKDRSYAKGFSIRQDQKSDIEKSNKEIDMMEKVLSRKAKSKNVKNLRGSLRYEDGNANIYVLFGREFVFKYGDEEEIQIDTYKNLYLVFNRLSSYKEQTYPVKFNLIVKLITRTWNGALYPSFYLERMEVLEFKAIPAGISDVKKDGDDDESIPSESDFEHTNSDDEDN